MGLTSFNEDEMNAIRHMVGELAAMKGEDTIGVIMWTGAFRCLGKTQEESDVAVVQLSRKIDGRE